MTMGDLWRPATIKEVLGRHGFRFSKALGQNFLIDPRVVPPHGRGERRGGVRRGHRGGAGPGGAHLRACPGGQKGGGHRAGPAAVPRAGETLADCPNVELVQGDVLKLDLHALIQEKFGGQEVCVCANLPYYITSPVIMGLLEGGLPLKSITVMVQKEAAERICAQPGQRACGAVSVSVHYHSQPQVLFGVSRGSSAAPAPRGLGGHPPGPAPGAPGAGGGRGLVFPGEPGRLCPAPENRGKLHLRLPGAAQGPGGGGPGGRRASPQMPGPNTLSLEQFAALANALPPLAKRGRIVYNSGRKPGREGDPWTGWRRI